MRLRFFAIAGDTGSHRGLNMICILWWIGEDDHVKTDLLIFSGTF